MSILRPVRVFTLSLSAGAVVTLAACGSSGGGTFAKATLSPNASPTPSASAKPSAAPATRTATGTGTTTTTGMGTGMGTGTGTGTGTGPTATFTLTTAPSCPSGTNLVHYDGNGATLSWTTTGASGVTILLDGDLFSSYGPSGSVTLPFSCTATPNTTQAHSYTLQTMGTQQLQRTVTASALVNEITDVGSGGGPATPSTSASP
jgi:hypothetical protein